MADRKATATANANIAFIKYWGNHDERLHLPLNDSISMNLDACRTDTTVEFEDGLEKDEILIGEQEPGDDARLRIVQQLDLIRTQANVKSKARVVSRSNFPPGTGMASSAAGFAALSAAATAAAGLSLDERDLSILARQGSGSACRSIPPGFVEWIASMSSATCYARSIAPPDFWDLRDVVAIVERNAKKVSSVQGHHEALTSPFLGERLNRLPARFHRLRRSLLAKDLTALGPDLEAEAIQLHMIAMTSRPPIFYWSPGMVRVVEAVHSWRDQGLPVYFTLDAGPNVHLICESKDAETVANQVRSLTDVQEVIVNAPGGGTHLLESHLF